MAIETLAPEQPTRINEVKVEDRSLEGLGQMLANGLKKETVVEKPLVPPVTQTVVDNLTKGLEANGEVKKEEKEIVVPAAETPQQIKLKEVTAAKEVIEKDLKLTKEEKQKAIAELESVKKTKKHWEAETEAVIGGDDKKEEKQPDYKEWEGKSKEYDEILKDPFIDAYVSAKKIGKDTATFLSEVQGTDPNKLSLEDLMKEQFKRENLSPEAIEAEMETFNDLKETAKIRQTKDIKNILIAERQNHFSKYALDNKQAVMKRQEAYMQSTKEKEQYLESIKGKVKEGVEMTSARLQELGEDFDNFNLFRKDGSLDVPRIMRIHLLEKYNSLRLENAYQQGRTEREMEGWQEIARPSATNGIAVVPENKNQSQKSETEKNLTEFDRLTQIRGRGIRVSN